MKAVLPGRLFPERQITANNILVDSMLIEAITQSEADLESDVEDILQTVEIPDADSTATAAAHVPTDSATEQNLPVNPTISTEGYVHLSRFYAKLNRIETTGSGKVRVAYFGDSMNDGDLIVQDVRDYFQNKFGGKGVGFVGMTSLSAGARYSVGHQYSKNWKIQSFVTTKRPATPFGIDGQVTFVKDSTNSYWVKYQARNTANTSRLYNATLFYGQADNDKASVTVKVNEEESEKALNPSQLLNTIKLTDTNYQTLQVSFSEADSIPFYGFNFDDGKGVHVDNFSLRGNSGLPLSTLNSRLMNRFDVLLGGYDLIVLHYGANVLSQDVESYGWYEKGMTRVVENLRHCFPNADVLIISTADKATKIEDEMKTDPAVPLLLSAQRRYAGKTGSGFVNLYSLMGGEGSMVEWVDNELAGKDYTHFNASGSKRISRFIYDEIDRGYQKFKLNMPQEEENNQILEEDETNIIGTE